MRARADPSGVEPVWAVIRQEDSVKRIVYSITNIFWGRMCISGDVPEVIEIPLPEGCPGNAAEVYGAGAVCVEVREGMLCWRPKGEWEAAAVYLK